MIRLGRSEIEALIDLPDAAPAIEAAYVAASEGRVNLPPVGHITFPEASADCHIKYGHMQGEAHFVIKVATGFPENAKTGIPTGNGLVLVMSAQTGEAKAIFHDEMLLTDIRTGLGGAIASRSLGRKNATRLLVVGTGPQARWQIRSHAALMPHLSHIGLWGRNPDRVGEAIDALAPDHLVHHEPNLEQAACVADIIVTATGATHPLIRSGWVTPGTHITAVGADAPGKQELDVDLVASADLVAVDLVSQCVDHGETAHAIGQGKLPVDRLVELGTILANPPQGRRDDHQITIADLTGIAAQDIAMANTVMKATARR